MHVQPCILILFNDKHREFVCDPKQVPYTLRQSGMFLVVEANIGLIIIWDKKTRITIKLTAKYKGNKVCGLCGNYDGDANNDFKTRSQAVVGDVLEFGNSWKVSSKNPDIQEIPNPCYTNPKRKVWAQKKCRIIISNVFADCHPQVDAAPYYDACLRDSCACDNSGDCDSFCTAVAAYAQACSEACSCIIWRTPDVCPVFCDFYNEERWCEWQYNPCDDQCIKTCRNPKGECLHELQGLEGCIPTCPPERPFFEEMTMACVRLCGCYNEDGSYYEPGQEVESCDVSKYCMLEPIGEVLSGSHVTCDAAMSGIGSVTSSNGTSQYGEPSVVAINVMFELEKLDTYNVPQLKQFCKEFKCLIRSSTKKEELQKALRDLDGSKRGR
ncbi:mucin-2-like [Pleurodeles waltl]|uniref:mucin-2-like n=1 Tax=Pleurodeles waltl TaxID=8319 RepID=UPI0037099BA0